MDLDQLKNIIGLLEGTLEFYSNIGNYGGVTGNVPLIELDRGEQARFTLKQVADLLKQDEESETDYNELLKQVGSADELPKNNDWEEFMEKIENLKEDGDQNV